MQIQTVQALAINFDSQKQRHEEDTEKEKGRDTIISKSKFALKTCSKGPYTCSNCLGRGSNPCSLHYGLTYRAIGNRPLYHFRLGQLQLGPTTTRRQIEAPLTVPQITRSSSRSDQTFTFPICLPTFHSL